NRVAALSILKQAAEDVGGKYTNKTEITGAGGGPIKTDNEHKPIQPILTPEELSAMSPLELSRLALTGKL
ncbi:MAG: hypothetical protein E6667_09260, partial [Acinetobacter junii]|nr:hypothetical protein [Acinetobacter junii]